MSRIILALQSDKHAGHVVGLCNPATMLPADDEVGRPTPMPVALTPFQEALWEMYRQDVEAVLDFADGDKVIVFDCGDQTHGHKYPDNQMSNRVADQFIIARYNWEPWMRRSNVLTFRFAKGTGSHTFGEGSSEMILADMLSLAWQGLSIDVHYHGVAEVAQGIRIDYAHHGPGPGMRDWTNGNQVRYYIKSLVLEQRRIGKNPCQLYCRGHRHAFVHEALLSDYWDGELHDFHVFTLPSYCGMGAYGHQATFSAPYQWFGTVAVEIIDGEIGRFKPFVHCRDIRTWEELYE